jgi:hypothetical protein
MKAQIQKYHSPDTPDLATYIPKEPDCFAVLLQIMIAPEESEGEESFDVLVCTPKYLEKKLEHGMPLFGRHMLIVKTYSWPQIRHSIEEYCNSLEGQDWSELAAKLARVAAWEFEDYRGSPRK